MNRLEFTDREPYQVETDPRVDDEIVAMAVQIVRERMTVSGIQLSTPSAVKDFAVLRLGASQVEQFLVLYLDCHLRLVADDVAFTGTLTQVSVYPREIVRAALHHNAANVILAHNHPSGSPEPSAADKMLTQALRDALHLVDVTVVDHIVVGQGAPLSFAERGLL